MTLHTLINSELKEQGWNDLYISGYSKKVHLFYYHSGKEAKNIIVLHTPVIAVKSCFESYEQLGRLYNFNVFALDYVPGEGECSGSCEEFTLTNMIANIDAAYDFICKNYSDDIHLLGYTGAGGILAQYYLGTGQKFRSFSQFACGIYGDASPLGIPKILSKPIFAIFKFLVWLNPRLTMRFKPPKAKGFHAEIDNAFYEAIPLREPNFFALKLNSTLRILECVLSKESLLKVPITCPTLIYKTLHDRYFSQAYFDRYFSALSCEKRMVEINDIHNSYFITPELFMPEAAQWFNNH